MAWLRSHSSSCTSGALIAAEASRSNAKACPVSGATGRTTSTSARTVANRITRWARAPSWRRARH